VEDGKNMSVGMLLDLGLWLLAFGFRTRSGGCGSCHWVRYVNVIAWDISVLLILTGWSLMDYSWVVFVWWEWELDDGVGLEEVPGINGNVNSSLISL